MNKIRKSRSRKSRSRKLRSRKLRSRKLRSRKLRSRKSRSRKPIVYLQKSTNSLKKFMVTIDNKTVHFGAKNYSDYTIHKDHERMLRYENRHRSRENWTKSGLKTAGFWSKWILWNKPSFIGSIKDTEKRFRIKIKYLR
jgi:hypothetical protein